MVDGEPAEGAFIVFHPAIDQDGEAWRAQGVSQNDGRFTLSTFRRGDGAPAGEYIVTVLWQTGEDDDGSSAGPDLLNNRYRDPKTSELRAEIKPGPNHLDPFQLSKQQK